MLHPFAAAYYSKTNRANLAALAVADLDTAEHLWGGPDYSRAFRNVLIGPPERRGEIWQAWVSTGEVELADDHLYYVLHHEQNVEGRVIDRWAVYAALDLHEPSLFVHEDVLPEGVERARQATEACETDLAPIFVGCEEGLSASLRSLLSGVAALEAPLVEYQEGLGTRHRVWPVKNVETANSIRRLFEGAALFLLDGHHRLAAARENHRLGFGDGRILACVCSMAPVDTLILPIHRAVHCDRWVLPDIFFADLVRAGCQLKEVPDLKVANIAAFLASHRESGPYCLALHSHSLQPMLVLLPTGGQAHLQLANLSVACLDFGVLAPQGDVKSFPISSLDQTLEQLALDQAQAAFFLPPARPGEVRAIALSKLRMPRKSTRFVPKPALGLVCRPWTS